MVLTAAALEAGPNVLVGADILRLTNYLPRWKGLMRGLLPGISENELRDLYKDAYELRKATVEDLKRLRADVRAGKQLTDQEYRDLQREKKKKISNLMRARADLEAYYKSLSMTTGEKTVAHVQQATNIFRSIQASYDASFAFRQGPLSMLWTPRQFHRPVGGLEHGATQEAFDNSLFQMENDPLVDEMKQYGWSSRAILRDARDFEEFYLSQLPMRLGDIEAKTTGRKIAAAVPKAIGKGFQVSERWFELQGDMQGLRVYEKWKSELEALAKDDPKFDIDRAKTHLVKVINAATGRGNFLREFRKGSQTAKLLSELFYSPRFMLSRPEFVWQMSIGLMRAPKGARKILAKKAVKLYSKTSLLLLPLAMLGLTSLDPEDDEFMQLRYGDTKTDLTGKLAESFRPVFMLAKGAYYYAMTLLDDPAAVETGRAGNEASCILRGRQWLDTNPARQAVTASVAGNGLGSRSGFHRTAVHLEQCSSLKADSAYLPADVECSDV